MSLLEEVWEAFLVAFGEEPVRCYLSDETEGQLAMLRVHDHLSAVSIAALLDECDAVAEVLGYEPEPSVREPAQAA